MKMTIKWVCSFSFSAQHWNTCVGGLKYSCRLCSRLKWSCCFSWLWENLWHRRSFRTRVLGGVTAAGGRSQQKARFSKSTPPQPVDRLQDSTSSCWWKHQSRCTTWRRFNTQLRGRHRATPSLSLHAGQKQPPVFSGKGTNRIHPFINQFSSNHLWWRHNSDEREDVGMKVPLMFNIVRSTTSLKDRRQRC